MVDVRLALRGAWQDHVHFLFIFYLENYYKKTDEHFSMIPASSRLWSKIFLKILSSMLDHPKGRGRATPIFYLENYYKKTNKNFVMIPFCSE